MKTLESYNEILWWVAMTREQRRVCFERQEQACKAVAHIPTTTADGRWSLVQAFRRAMKESE